MRGENKKERRSERKRKQGARGDSAVKGQRPSYDEKKTKETSFGLEDKKLKSENG